MNTLNLCRIARQHQRKNLAIIKDRFIENPLTNLYKFICIINRQYMAVIEQCTVEIEIVHKVLCTDEISRAMSFRDMIRIRRDFDIDNGIGGDIAAIFVIVVIVGHWCSRWQSIKEHIIVVCIKVIIIISLIH